MRVHGPKSLTRRQVLAGGGLAVVGAGGLTLAGLGGSSEFCDFSETIWKRLGAYVQAGARPLTR